MYSVICHYMITGFLLYLGQNCSFEMFSPTLYILTNEKKLAISEIPKSIINLYIFIDLISHKSLGS